MQLLLLICFVFATSGKNAYPQVAETDILKLTQRMNDYVTDCMTEGNIDISTDDATAILSDEPDDDKEEITRCFFYKAGILKPDGQLNPEAAMAVLTLIGVEKKDAEDLLNQCASLTGYDAKDMVYAIFKCFDNGMRT